ncbi:MAG: endonuclease/exonuclease/phosphatase family protein [Opitutales bacterium]
MFSISRLTLLSILSFVQLCLLAEASAGLRMATYNVRNYLVMDRYLEGRWQPQYPKPEKEKTMVRQIIRETSPDILALQEMGPPAFLQELRADLAEEGLEYPHVIHFSGPDTERHLAILSKIAPLEVVEHNDLDFKYFDRRERVKRGMLEVSFEAAEGKSFKLFVVHLKSKYTDEKADPESQLRRTREAEACRNRIVERTFDLGVERFLVAGDFNDHPDSSPLRRFYQRGDLEIGRLLPAADSRGEVWTYFFERRGQYSLVDGFVVSAEMFPLIAGGRGEIVDSPGALHGSDHRMVYLDLVEW